MSPETLAVSVDDRRKVLSALRSLGGRATVADVVGASGLSVDRAETALRAVIETHRGHMEATNDGELVYSFPGGVVPRDHIPFPVRVWNAAKAAAVWGFKAWTLLMLAGYSLLFAVLAVVLLVVVMVKGEGEWEGGAEILWVPLRVLFEVWFWFGLTGRHDRRPPKRLRGHTKGVPIPERVFRFLFGPPDATPSLETLNRRAAALIRDQRGVLSALDLVRIRGLSLDEASDELARLTVALGGDFEVSPRGEVVALFPELVMDSSALREAPAMRALPGSRAPAALTSGRASGATAGGASAPPPVWAAVPAPPPFSGNPAATDGWILGMNAFNLAASGFVVAGAGAAGVALTTVLGPGSTSVATWILGWIPLTFSLLLFGVPLFRVPRWRRRRDEIEQIAARAAVLRLMLEGSPDHAPTLSLTLLKRRNPKMDADRLRIALEQVSAELEASVEAGADGELVHRFDAVPRLMAEAASVRESRALDDRSLGEIIYSSDDDAEEAARRDLRRFDLDLGGDDGGKGGR